MSPVMSPRPLGLVRASAAGCWTVTALPVGARRRARAVDLETLTVTHYPSPEAAAAAYAAAIPIGDDDPAAGPATIWGGYCDVGLWQRIEPCWLVTCPCCEAPLADPTADREWVEHLASAAEAHRVALERGWVPVPGQLLCPCCATRAEIDGRCEELSFGELAFGGQA